MPSPYLFDPEPINLTPQELLNQCLYAVFGDDQGGNISDINEQLDDITKGCKYQAVLDAAALLKAYSQASFKPGSKSEVIKKTLRACQTSHAALYDFLLSASFFQGYADFLVAFEAAFHAGGVRLNLESRYHKMLEALTKGVNVQEVLSCDDKDLQQFQAYVDSQHGSGDLDSKTYRELCSQLAVEALMDEGADDELPRFNDSYQPGSDPSSSSLSPRGTLHPTPVRSPEHPVQETTPPSKRSCARRYLDTVAARGLIFSRHAAAEDAASSIWASPNYF